MRAKTIGAAGFVALVNVVLVWPLFQVEYTNQMGSIEGAFISIARYILHHFPHLDWFPLWYNGVPYQNTYPPLLHLSVAALSALMGLSPGVAYHALTAALYCLGPVALFYLIYRLSGSRTQAFFGALGYSLFSPSYFLMADVHKDALHLGGARRFQTLFEYGEGPHIASLMLLVVAVSCLDSAVRRGGTRRWLLCSLVLAATVLTNWIGAFALAVCCLCYLLARGRGWGAAAVAAVYAYIIAAPWIPPSTLRAIAFNSQYVEGRFDFTARHYLYLAVFAIVVAGLTWLLARLRAPLEIRFAVLLTAIFGSVVLLFDWYDIAVVPQPARYHLELDIAVCMLAAACIERLSRLLPPRLRIVVGASLACACVPVTLDLRQSTAGAIKAIDIRQTGEYRTAQWIDTHLPNSRVYVAGTTSFWLNNFTEAPQLAGGFDQGDINHVMPWIRYQIMAREPAEASLAWLRVYAVDAVVVPGPDSDDLYKPFAFPRKFDGVLPVLSRDRGVTIYSVPRRQASLAHVVERSELAPEFNRLPEQFDYLRPFLDAIEDPQRAPAAFQWQSSNRARITATLRPDQLVVAAIAFHPGWHARVNGESRKVWGDRLGLTVVEPRCDGNCTIELIYDGGFEMKLLQALSWTLLAGGLAAALLEFRG